MYGDTLIRVILLIVALLLVACEECNSIQTVTVEIMDDESKTEYILELQEKGIPYKLLNDGVSILVYDETIYSLGEKVELE
ncbi:hypothetical protein LCGC14_2398790 [marine sediment metagenome]|uniref:Uncharacterized protein n=1 Tax=marine sediment metagenome TaxID=412755 RepID=A0A0F9CI11_9ZZZZ